MTTEEIEIRLDLNRGIKRTATCGAIIWHGPGHQSVGRCDVKGSHRQHHTSGPRNEYYWSGKTAMSGFFDESPEERKE